MTKTSIPDNPEDMDPDLIYCERCTFTTKSEKKAIKHAKEVHGVKDPE